MGWRLRVVLKPHSDAVEDKVNDWLRYLEKAGYTVEVRDKESKVIIDRKSGKLWVLITFWYRILADGKDVTAEVEA